MAKRDFSTLEDLASTELDDWFVSERLVLTTLEHSRWDREAARELLQRAIEKIDCTKPLGERLFWPAD